MDTAGVAQGNGELVLRLPLGFFTWSQQGFLMTAGINLNDHPAEFGRFKIEHERAIGSHRSIDGQSCQWSFRYIVDGAGAERFEDQVCRPSDLIARQGEPMAVFPFNGFVAMGGGSGGFTLVTEG